MLSPTIAALGNPAERAGQAIQKRNKVNRLLELERTQGQFADKAAGLNASPHSGPDFSGYDNEYEYRQGLNRAGEMAGLQSELSGRGPAKVQHTYAGTEFAMGPATRALQNRATDIYEGPTDNLDYFGRLAAVQGQNVQNERQRNAEFRERTLDDPVFAARRRAINRADTIDEGGAKGEAAAAEYLAPGQDTRRRQETWDLEDRRRTLAPFDPAALRGEATLGSAALAADARRYAADASAGARTGSAAMNSLGRLAGTMITSPDQGARVDSASGTIRPNVPGQGQPPQGMKPFPAGRLQSFAQQNGFSSVQAAAEYLRQVGYEVQ